jgi:C_GCAxxG_C_C family probable redox protein
MLAVGGHLFEELDSRTLKIASVFAGGVAGTREELCGALSGGVMVIGALHGRSTLSEDEEQARQLAAQYRERFLAEFGSTRCADVRERVLLPDGSADCAMVGERAASILLKLLGEV